MTFLEITHPDHCEACVHAIQSLLNGEITSYSTEKRCLRKNGSPVWVRVNVSLVRDHNHAPQYFIGVMEDSTERIQVESALRESEQRLTLALSAARLSVWDCNLREKSITLSPPNTALGDPRTFAEWVALIHPDDKKRLLVLAAESVVKKKTWKRSSAWCCRTAPSVGYSRRPRSCSTRPAKRLDWWASASILPSVSMPKPHCAKARNSSVIWPTPRL